MIIKFTGILLKALLTYVIKSLHAVHTYTHVQTHTPFYWYTAYVDTDIFIGAVSWLLKSNDVGDCIVGDEGDDGNAVGSSRNHILVNFSCH